MSLSTFVLTFLVAYGVRNYLWPLLRRADIHRLPGPSSSIASWIWGHELLAFQHEAEEMYTAWARSFGPMFRIKAALFHSDIIVATDHAAVQYIFADTTNYVKSPAFRPPAANVLGRGLVWAEGEDHAKMRKILAPAFSQDSVKQMASDIYECAEKMETRLTNYILSHSGDEAGLTVNIGDWTSPCTLDIIGRVAFGYDFKAISTTGYSDAASEPVTDASLIRASWTKHTNMTLSPIAFVVPLIFRMFPAEWIAKLPLPPGVVRGVVRRLAGRILEREEEAGALNAGGSVHISRSKDIMSLLLNARRTAKRENSLTDDQILDNPLKISTFTMVGHETTAGSLNFTLLALARHPHIQTRLREEILAHGRDSGYDDLQKLTYLDAVVKEGLRLYPASPQTERVALKDDVIPLSKPIRGKDGRMIRALKVSKGQVLHIPFTVMQTNPQVWGPDAGSFDPSRWIKKDGLPAPNELPHGWSGLVTFCDGPRNCIGWRLAVFEFKVILASLIRSFEFHDTSAVIHQKIAPTLQPVTDGKGGLLPLHVTLA
ncbi:cytochrome P450 [Pleurotus eryngii]|uniref:Cytochrome P450 n=1 Tax=Pleurotus eryngii TaxID=5323 RepID=A0A9P6A6U1_PLEER|nr:cytochrome P450 [Pleurotus eryngii]